jgi:flagellar biosynthesis/type III secretory pathway protein FliH
VEDLIRWYAGGINECEGGGYDEAILAGRRAIAEHDKEVIEKSAKRIRECAMFKWEKEAHDEAYSTGYLRGHIEGMSEGYSEGYAERERLLDPAYAEQRKKMNEELDSLLNCDKEKTS